MNVGITVIMYLGINVSPPKVELSSCEDNNDYVELGQTQTQFHLYSLYTHIVKCDLCVAIVDPLEVTKFLSNNKNK